MRMLMRMRGHARAPPYNRSRDLISDHSFHVPSRRSTRHTGAAHDVEKLSAIRGRPRPALEEGRVGDLHGPAPVVSARVTKLGDGYVGLGAKNR